MGKGNPVRRNGTSGCGVADCFKVMSVGNHNESRIIVLAVLTAQTRRAIVKPDFGLIAALIAWPAIYVAERRVARFTGRAPAQSHRKISTRSLPLPMLFRLSLI